MRWSLLVLIFFKNSLVLSSYTGATVTPGPQHRFITTALHESNWSWSIWSNCIDNKQTRYRICNTFAGFHCFGQKHHSRSCQTKHRKTGKSISSEQRRFQIYAPRHTPQRLSIQPGIQNHQVYKPVYNPALKPRYPVLSQLPATDLIKKQPLQSLAALIQLDDRYKLFKLLSDSPIPHPDLPGNVPTDLRNNLSPALSLLKHGSLSKFIVDLRTPTVKNGSTVSSTGLPSPTNENPYVLDLPKPAMLNQARIVSFGYGQQLHVQSTQNNTVIPAGTLQSAGQLRTVNVSGFGVTYRIPSANTLPQPEYNPGSKLTGFNLPPSAYFPSYNQVTTPGYSASAYTPAPPSAMLGYNSASRLPGYHLPSGYSSGLPGNNPSTSQSGYGTGTGLPGYNPSTSQSGYGTGTGLPGYNPSTSQSGYGTGTGLPGYNPSTSQSGYGTGTGLPGYNPSTSQSVYGTGTGLPGYNPSTSQSGYGTGTGLPGYNPSTSQSGYATGTGLPGYNPSTSQSGYGTGTGLPGYNPSTSQSGYGTGTGLPGYNPSTSQSGYGSGTGLPGYNPSTSQSGYGTGTGLPGYNPSTSQSGYATGTGLPGYNPSTSQSGYGTGTGLPGYNPSTSQSGYGSGTGLPGYNPSTSQSGYGTGTGLPGYNPSASQSGYGTGTGLPGYNPSTSQPGNGTGSELPGYNPSTSQSRYNTESRFPGYNMPSARQRVHVENGPYGHQVKQIIYEPTVSEYNQHPIGPVPPSPLPGYNPGSASRSPGYNAPSTVSPTSIPGYNPGSGLPGYNAPSAVPPTSQPGYNSGLQAYNPPTAVPPTSIPGSGSPGYNAPSVVPLTSIPGYNTGSALPGYNPPSVVPPNSQPGYNSGLGSPGYNVPSGRPYAYDETGSFGYKPKQYRFGPVRPDYNEVPVRPTSSTSQPGFTTVSSTPLPTYNPSSARPPTHEPGSRPSSYDRTPVNELDSGLPSYRPPEPRPATYLTVDVPGLEMTGYNRVTPRAIHNKQEKYLPVSLTALLPRHPEPVQTLYGRNTAGSSYMVAGDDDLSDIEWSKCQCFRESNAQTRCKCLYS